MNGSLTILIGAARAGKSTYAKENWREVNDVIVNSDQIRLAIHGERYKAVLEPLVHYVTTIFVKVLHAMNYNVLVDETNTTLQSIIKWLEIDPAASFYILDTPVEVCKQRAIASGQPDLVEKGVIDRHFDNMKLLMMYKRVNKGELLSMKDLVSAIKRITDDYGDGTSNVAVFPYEPEFENAK